MEKTPTNHQEKIISTKVPAEDLEQWANDLRESGLSRDEVADIISRLSVSWDKREKPSAIKNITIPKEDVQ
ncbi:MAG: hypothetical protein Q7R79_02485, partial [bacterium]|nr:hypothetical protein [bacterium]